MFFFAYLNTIFAIAQTRSNPLVKLFRIVMWLLLGPFVLLIKICNDTIGLCFFLSDIKFKKKRTISKKVKDSKMDMNTQNDAESKNDSVSYVLNN